MARVTRDLAQMFTPAECPALLVGLQTGDDAAVYRMDAERALVVTTDFFPPIVDDAYSYGAVAAANSMSDVYAMGGEVLVAVNIAAFPPDLPDEVVREIFRGGADRVRAAGGVLAGGHTIDDAEPKYGLAVVGTVRPDRIATKAGARPGDALVLTKPLGSGMVTTAIKLETAEPDHVQAVTASMVRLNKVAAGAMQAGEFHACSDVTGFSLLGHAWEIAEQSGVRLRVRMDDLPWLPGAIGYADKGPFAAGSHRNAEAYGEHVTFTRSVSEKMALVLYTPETSGGLLIALPPEEVGGLISRMSAAGERAWTVGQVRQGDPGVEIV